jgi:hypothetical protein
MLLIAAGAALAINASYIVQHSGLAIAPRIDPRRPVAAVGTLLRCPRWMAGAALGYAGLGLELLALTALPLSAVQATIGGGLVLVAALGGVRDRVAQLGAVLAIGALAILAAVTPAAQPHAPPAGALGAGSALVIAAAALAARRSLALAAGLLYGVTSLAVAVLAPSLVGAARPSVVVAVALIAAVPATAVGFLCFQRALQCGRPLAVVTAMMAAMDVAAIGGGLAILGDPLAAGAGARAAQLAALALASLSALVVGREPAGTQEPPRLARGRDAERRPGIGWVRPRPRVPAADQSQVGDRDAAPAGRPFET